jgi:hypothetical protein
MRRRWAALALLACVLHAPAARADDAEERARTLFREGREAADRGEHRVACARFAASLALMRRPSTLLNLGACHDELGHSATALRYWRLGQRELEADDKRQALAAEAIAALEARAPRLRFSLEGVPAEAVVRLDGAPVDARDELRVDPGDHRVTLSAAGHEDTAVKVALADGDDKTIALVLGARVATAPPPPPRVEPEPEREGEGIPIWVWPTGALGLASAGVAVAFAVDYASTVSRQEERCRGALEACSPDPPGSYDPADDNAQKERDAILGTVFGVAGGIAIVASIVGIAVGADQPVAIDARGLRFRF